MSDTREGWADRTIFTIWFVAGVWFVDGVIVTLVGLYLAGEIR